jgi:hypothetical protein
MICQLLYQKEVQVLELENKEWTSTREVCHNIKSTNLDSSPPPDSYNLNSEFKKAPVGKAFSFGISREAYKSVLLNTS